MRARLPRPALPLGVTFFRLLGPVEVQIDGRTVELGGPKQRAVLARLLLDAGRVVSTDQLLDAVWGEDQPPSVLGSLQNYISNLRRLLRDDELAISPIVRQAPGYLIDVSAQDLDVGQFQAHSESGHAALSRSEWTEASEQCELALALWRGPPLVEHGDEEWVRVAAAALQERRAGCEQDLVTALLGSDRVTSAVTLASRLRAEQPLSERVCWLYMIALYRAGRQADALAAFGQHTEAMRDELGLDGGAALGELQGAILRQDPDLAHWPAPSAAGSAPLAPEALRPGHPQFERAGSPAEAVGDRDAAAGLVGRGQELDSIDAVLNAPRENGPAWIVLTGVAGIGKSRLAAAAAARWIQRGDRLCRTSCPDDDGVPPWWPIRQLLNTLNVDLDSFLLAQTGVDVDAARFAVYEYVLRQLADAARHEPLLLLIDDIQWADDATLKFLTYLAETPGPPNLAIMLTVRDEVGGNAVARLLGAVSRSDGSRQLALSPLSRSDIVMLADHISGQSVDPSEVDELVHLTSGNPFFVCEYARLPAAARRSGAAPVAIRSLLARRLDGLDPAVLEVLRAAALIGDSLDVPLLRRVTQLELDDLADLLDQAADEHIVVAATGSGTYTFAHALLRQEVTAGLPNLRRQRLHKRIADAITPGTDGDRLAQRATHLLEALPLVDAAEVFEACRAVARAADAHWYSDSAATWWGRALEVYDQMDQTDSDAGIDRDELVLAQVAALARAGRGQTVLDVVEAAVLDAVRNSRISSAGRLAATMLRTSGSWPWAVYGSDPSLLLARLEGIEPLVRHDAAAHARVLATLAVGSCYDPDPAVPDQLSARAITLAEELKDDDVLADAILARALTFAGVASRSRESIALLTRLSALPHQMSQIDDVLTHSLLSMPTLTLADTTAAAEHVRLGAVGSDLLRLPVARAQLRWAEGTLEQWRGQDLTAVESLYDHAYFLHQQTELYTGGVHDVAILALRWEQGRLSEAADLGSGNVGLAAWVGAVVSAARNDHNADELIAAEIARVEPPVWTTLGRLVMLAHATADRGLSEQATVLLGRLQPFVDCIANIGQVGVVGPVALALARLSALLGDVAAAGLHLEVAGNITRRTHAASADLRCRLFALQLSEQSGQPVDPTSIQDIVSESLQRGLLGVGHDATELLGRQTGTVLAV